jgi:hypothetical protein
MRFSDSTTPRHRGPMRPGARTRALRVAAAIPALGFAACVLFLGCRRSTMSRLNRQIDWVANNPKASSAVKQTVLGKKLQEGVGMTPDAVIASWGRPHEKLDLGGGDARWIYRRGQHRNTGRVVIEYTLVFNRGYLMRVVQRERR